MTTNDDAQRCSKCGSQLTEYGMPINFCGTFAPTDRPDTDAMARAEIHRKLDTLIEKVENAKHDGLPLPFMMLTNYASNNAADDIGLAIRDYIEAKRKVERERFFGAPDAPQEPVAQAQDAGAPEGRFSFTPNEVKEKMGALISECWNATTEDQDGGE